MAPTLKERRGGFVDPQLLFPCFVPPPNDLRAGDVVRHIDDGTVGVVTSSPASSWGDVRVRTSASSAAVTNNSHGCWQVIPESEQTYEQRVESLIARTDRQDDPTKPAEDESFEWHLLLALLDHEEFEAMYPDYEWPTTTTLAMAVAAKLDRLIGLSGDGGTTHD